MPSSTSERIHPIHKKTERRARAAMLLVISLSLLFSAGYVGWQKALSAWISPGEYVGGIVTVPHGSSFESIVGQLIREGVIESSALFRLGVMFLGIQRNLQAGEFHIPANASLSQIAETLAYGRSISYRVTIPEGTTSWEVVQLLRSDPDLVGEITSIPEEGSLLPETYYFERGTKRTDVLNRMEQASIDVLDRLWQQRNLSVPLRTPYEAVILASIVEKETALPEERPLVAAVFLNRLERGMRLQADPTVIYGLTLGKETLGRPLRRSELDKETPYNSYRRGGLPPTPICNPGVASLEAVLNPEESDLLYFVANGEGGHRFAATLEEHRRNVAAWRNQ